MTSRAPAVIVRAVLTLVYYLIVTPLGLVLRLLRDPLARRLDRRAGTYWVAPEGTSI